MKKTVINFLSLMIVGTMIFVSSCVKKEVKKDNVIQPDDKTVKADVITTTSTATNQVFEDTATSEANAGMEEAMSLDVIHFDFDKYDITSDAKETLSKNAKILIDNHYMVTVEGHCDDRGTNQYNLSLGQKRANTVRDYYVRLGVPENHIATISYGEEKPLCTDQTEECWAKNRRAETKVNK
jgi:peptidoglycan-associated lipoprotein